MTYTSRLVLAFLVIALTACCFASASVIGIDFGAENVVVSIPGVLPNVGTGGIPVSIEQLASSSVSDLPSQKGVSYLLSPPFNTVEIVLNDQSARKTPNYIGFRNDGADRYFGEDAKNLAGRFPDLMVPSVQRLVGISSQSTQLDELKNIFKIPFSIAEPHKARDTLKLTFGASATASFTADELLGMIFLSIKRTVERNTEQTYHGEPVQSAVVTVPHFFTARQRQAVVDAAAMAGIRVLSLMHPPTAAALQYGIQNNGFEGKPKRVVMLDMGSMSTHVGVYEYSGTPKQQQQHQRNLQHKGALGNITTLALVSSSSLGGKSIDACVARLIDAEASAALKIPLTLGDFSVVATDAPRRKAVHSLMRAANKVKEMLSVNRNAPYTVEGITGEKDFSSKMSRETFERHCVPTDALLKLVDEALEMAGISNTDVGSAIDRFEIIGGGARVPKLLDDIKQHVFQGTRDVDRTTNSDEAAAIGAGYRAAALTNTIHGAPTFAVFDAFALHNTVSLSFGNSKPRKLFLNHNGVERSATATLMEKQVLPSQRTVMIALKNLTSNHVGSKSTPLQLTLHTEQVSKHTAGGLHAEEVISIADWKSPVDRVAALGTSTSLVEVTGAAIRAMLVCSESGLYFLEAVEMVVSYNKTSILPTLEGQEADTNATEPTASSKNAVFPLEFTRETNTFPKPLDALEATLSKRRLSILQAVDDEKLATAAARNDLETFALWVRTDSTFDESTGLFKNGAEGIQQAARETVEWLEMEATDDTPKSVFVSKRFALRNLVHTAAHTSDKENERKCKTEACALAAVRRLEPKLSAIVEASLSERADLDSLLSTIGGNEEESEIEAEVVPPQASKPEQADEASPTIEEDGDELDEL